MRTPYRLKDLTGYNITARDGEVGKLEEVFFDDRYWIVRYLVVRTGGWLSGQKALVVPDVISGIDEEAKLLEIDMSREQVENCPPIDTQKPVSRHYEQEYYRYYGWEPYWSADPMLGIEPPVIPPPENEPQEPENPHLRSSDEVKSYSIRTRDGDIGYVEDFIVEEPGWRIRYLEIGTGNWLLGKHVLLAPAWIERVDWALQEVTVSLGREAIETAPPYDPHKTISRDYQVALYQHYGEQYEGEN